MVSIHFLTSSEGLLQGFLMEGHAGAGEAGQDVVCAAISSAGLWVTLTVSTVFSTVCSFSTTFPFSSVWTTISVIVSLPI